MNYYEELNALPFYITNIIYSYLGKSKTAVIIEEYWENKLICPICDIAQVQKNSNMCYYCHAEEIGIYVYKCDNYFAGCCGRTLNYTDFNNTEYGFLCNECADDYDEEDNEDE